MYIYVTDECDQRCPHCWIRPVREGHSSLTSPRLDQYFEFIDAARPMGLRYVKVTGGEPLLRRETFAIVEHSAQAGISSTIESNAMLVGEEQACFFRDHKVHIGVSLDGASPEVHDRRRGLIGAFERTMRAIRLMAATGVPLTVTCAVSRSNLGEIEKILELLSRVESRARIVFKINPIVPIGRARSMKRRGETLEPHELLHLAETVYEKLLPRFEPQGLKIMLQLEAAFFSVEGILNGLGKAGTRNCGFLSLISVLADGSITFCGIGYAQRHLVMGSIREEYDLPKLWNAHPLLTEVRRRVRHGLKGICGHCLFHPVCLGGCRASAVAVGGSLASSPPWCQALYEAGWFPATRLDDDAAREYKRIAPRLRAAHGARTGIAEKALWP
jgi:SynChlorMet cassette radical SAM/SPASM protein ScmF